MLKRASFLLISYLISINLLAMEVETHGGSISETTTWTNEKVHLITSNLSIEEGFKLTIEPGAIVKFNSSIQLVVHGDLIAVGTIDSPIYFTSSCDDSVGGESNNDGVRECSAGDWEGIQFEDTVDDALTQLSFIDLRFSGQSQAAIYTNRANITISDSVIRDSGHHGIETYYASPIISRNKIINSKMSGISVGKGSYPLIEGNEIIGSAEHGIYVPSNNSSPEISGNLIEENQDWGIYYKYSRDGPVLTNNVIINNNRGLTIPTAMMPSPEDGNILLPNAINAIWLRGNSLSRNLTLAPLSNEGVNLNTYVVMGRLGVNSGYRLTLSPGVVMKFQYWSDLYVSGELGSVGTADAPIVFTSYADDSVGGDTNGDGYGSSPESGDWKEIRFNSSSPDDASPMEYVEVRYAGQESTAGIKYYSDQSLAHAKISYSYSSGIYNYNSTVTLADVYIFGNQKYGFYSHNGTSDVNNAHIFANGSHGIYSDSSTVNISGGEVFANNGYGAYLGLDSSINTNDIWWGATDGAGGADGGSGDEISGGVNNTNQRTDGTEYSYFNAGGTDSISYGIVTPIVSGTPSQEFGEGASDTVHYEETGTSITAEYTGLDTNASYQLFATYPNSIDYGHIQNVTAQNGNEIIADYTIHGISRLSGIVSPEMIQEGYLQFSVNRKSGFRTSIAELLLIKNQPDSREFSITLNSPSDGAIIGNSGVMLSGDLAEQHINEQVEIGFSQDDENYAWLPVGNQGSDKWSHFWQPEISAQYYIKARLKQPTGKLTYSDTINVETSIDDPAAVEHLLAISDDNAIKLDWQPSDEDIPTIYHYQIFRYQGAGFELIDSLAPDIYTYLDEQVVLEQDYLYFVRAVSKSGNSSDSRTVGPINIVAEPDSTAPNEVTVPSVDYSLNDSELVTALIRWNTPTENSAEVTEYRVYLSTNNGASFEDQFARLESGITSYLAKGLNTQTSYTFKITTVDMFGNESVGKEVSFTPVEGVAKAISLSGSLSHDLLLDEGIYHILSEYIVPEGIKLTVANDVVIKFSSDAVFYVEGNILTQGDEANLVAFTAITDDLGGDTNGDGDDTIPTAGYWRGISNYNNKGHIALNYAQLKYAGTSNWSVYSNYGSVDLNHVTISQGQGRGIDARWSTVNIKNSLIEHLTGHGVYLNNTNLANIHNSIIQNTLNGIHSEISKPSIIGNTIINNTNYGIYFEDATIGHRLQSNVIQNNELPMRIPAAMYPDSSNTLFPNNVNRFRILGGNLADSNHAHFASYFNNEGEQLAEYLIEGTDLLINGKRLSIDAGVVVKLSDNVGIRFSGSLIAQGTVEYPIIFTSSHDDTAIGDSNNNGNATTPQRGDWSRLEFYGGSQTNRSELTHVKIRFAAQALKLQGAGGTFPLNNVDISNTNGDAIVIYWASPTITNSVFWANSNIGINIQGDSAPKITFSGVMLNGLGGIKVADNANPSITNSRFFSNNQYAIDSTSSQLINAEYNWWGDFDASGPEHTDNATGTGGFLSGNINFGQYVAANNLDYLYVNFDVHGVVNKGNMPDVDIIQGSLTNDWDLAENHPSKTVLTDKNLIHFKLTGLNPNKNYKLGLTYFNGDQSGNLFNLTDGNGNPIHSSQIGPQSMPTLYNFLLPPSYYTAGEVEVKLHHESNETAIRAAISELYLVEAIDDFTPPKFESIAFDDQDGSETLTLGDVLHFNLSEEVQLTPEQSLVADELFITDLDKSFGDINETVGSVDNKSFEVTLTTNFTIENNEVVTIQGLTDMSGYSVIGSQSIDLADTISPEMISVQWLDVDGSGQLSTGDQYEFTFSEVMDSNHLSDNTTDANANLRPYGGKRYGNNNLIAWSNDNRSVLVTVTEGFTIQGDEVVVPNAFITDRAGNAATGEIQLQGKDITQPHRLDLKE